MTPGTFVRCTRGHYAGMTGTLVGRCIGDETQWWVRLTSTEQHVRVAEADMGVERRTSELRAAARERLRLGESVRGIRERLRGAA